ncbi:autotransporter outer membrane beta-barrel domain-containing protein [Stenotrophomonas sp. C1657]|uniref:autotransporter outer membrane beta-barrel domain-containing protein n=1 Tax=Stenotrophomonas sp. C1657 TaxID=3077844 RepID=UPI00293C8654|nr:autotransporter outer membrane beta-barrel domain-containing protein [Stenotrophomonas sp. C1657]MDV3514578.1 autotransporter outer membrane beta-barrel domain-containing protein [Stenotrophomonas sp. C1657]
MRTTLSRARRVLSLSVAAALVSPVTAGQALANNPFAANAGEHKTTSGQTYSTTNAGWSAVGAKDGGTIDAERTTAASHASYTETVGAIRGGIINFAGGSVSSAGLGSSALRANSDGTINVTRDAAGNRTLINVTGSSSAGARAGGGGVINLDGVHIIHTGDRSNSFNFGSAVAVDDGGTINMSDAILETTGLAQGGISAGREGASAIAINSSISTQGDRSHGAHAYLGASVALDAVSIETRGNGASGLLASQAGSIAQARGTSIVTRGDHSAGGEASEGGLAGLIDTRIETYGNNAHGVYSRTGGTATASNTDIVTSGGASYGVLADGAGSRVEFLESSISTSGKDAHAAWIDAGGTADIINSRLVTTGGAARGVNATKGSQVTIADSTIHTNSGELRDAHGVYANGSSHVAVNNVEIVTDGARSRGLLADAASISADRVSIATSGSESIGVLGINAATLSLNNAAISTSGASGHGVSVNTGSQLALDGAVVETSGDNAFGVIVRNDGSHADLQRLQVLTEGSNGIGLSLDYGASTAVLDDSQIVTKGAGSHAARVQDGAVLDINNSVLKSEAAAALLLTNGTLTATDGTAIEGNGTLIQFGSDAANTLVFDRNVVALGDVRFAAGSIDEDGNGALDRTSSLQLDNNSYWSGATDAIGDLSLANGSRWDVTGGSQVGTLSLMSSSVVFDHADGQYKTLTVDGNFHADNGLLVMNTALGDDASPTDLLHVKGDTSGNAHIAVNNIGGTGAQTEDGIKLVQVDGASAGEYALAGRAVGGAYEYFLYQGGHTDPNDGDWYLRSELSPVEPPVDPCDGNDCPIDPPVDPCKGNDCTIDPPVTPAPVFRPEAGAYLANQASALGLFNMDLHERVGEPNLAQRQRGDGDLGSAWVRVTTDQPRYRVNDQLMGQGRQNVVQIGSDVTFWGKQDRGVVGIMAASGQATNRVTSSLTGYGAEGRVDGRALGVYSTWIQDAEDDDGLYIDGWLQAAHFKNRVQGDALAREHYRSRSLSASVEAGYAVRLHQSDGSALYLEPQVQAIWTDYRMDGGQHQEVNGTVVKAAEAGGLQTRVGARVYGHSTAPSGNRVQPFVGVNWIRNGSDANAVWLGEQRLQGIVPKNVYEAKAGAQLQLSPNLTGWGELSVQQGDYGFRSVGAQLGVKYAW